MKQKAVSTQIKEAKAAIDELTKKLANAESTRDTWYRSHNQVADELAQIHQILDAVPNPVSRESEGENTWDRVKRTTVTRLGAWLAVR